MTSDTMSVGATPLTLDKIEKIAESMKTLHHLLQVQDQILTYRANRGNLAHCQIEGLKGFAIDMSFVLQSVVKDIDVVRINLIQLGVTL